MKLIIQYILSASNFIKWTLIFSILFIMIFLNLVYKDHIFIVRILYSSISILLSLIIFTITDLGRNLINFIKDSKIELKKVVWPSYYEVFKITLIICIFTIVSSILLWFLDRFLFYIISLITKLRI